MSHRILYLIGQLGTGGLERQLYYLLRTLDRQRYKPAVAVWNFCEEDVYVPHIRALGVPLYALPRQGSRAVRLKALRCLLRQLQPEVLHSYTFHTNFGAWWATRGTKILAIGSVRSDFTRVKQENGLARLNARWPRYVIFNNFAAAEAAQQSRSMFVPQKSLVVRNGLDLQRFPVAPLLTSGRVRILGIGSLFRIKRWDRLLEAAWALKRHGLDFSVQIAGDGPLDKALKQQAQDMKIAGCVKFLGYQNDIARLLAEATFLVHTSDSEGCPNVVMEAMACGRAVVATDVGDIPYLVEEGKTGFVVRRGDDAMLVARMAMLIGNRAVCRRMGEAARVKAEQEFGLDRLVAETLTAYRAAGWSNVEKD
jgi:glycosyltransferase involved in cell wall biosynthesis